VIEPLPDVLIVGGGIVGASIAWRVAQLGLRVTVIDAGAFGGESSAAGAGMLSPGGEVHGSSRWAFLSVESRRLYPSFVAGLYEESGVLIDLRQCGALELAHGEDEWAAIETRVREQAPLGIWSEPVPHADALKRVPGLAPESFTHARWFPGDAMVDPLEVTRALRIALERRGGTIIEHEPVTSIDVQRGVVRTKNQDWNAGAIVIAAGAWSGLLNPELPRSAPVKGHLIGYDLEPGTLGPIVRHGHTYLLQRSSGFTIAGATMEHAGFDRSVSPETVRALAEAARAHLPRLFSGEPDRAWIGFRPAVDAPEPAVGRVPETDVWLAYGHLRNGILLAPVTGKLIASDIVHGQDL
jgi:glycine oxidase